MDDHRVTSRAAAVALFATLAAPPVAASEADLRTLAVREGATASLLDGALKLEVVKIRGYGIDVRVNGTKQAMKLGHSFTPEGADCQVTFQKISPETRIARFQTDCP